MQFYPSGMRIAGRYEAAGRPLKGGRGIVYLCVDLENDGRPVALKTFKPECLADRVVRDRFLREGTTWIGLGAHPHIVRAYWVLHISDGREVYLVLELVAREPRCADASLRSWLAGGRVVPVPEALLIALQIARGMKHAAAMVPGLVHRGKAEVARGYFERALEAGRAEVERTLEGAALGNLGVACDRLGDARRAIAYHEQALAIDREIGYRRGEGQDLGNLGNAYSALGDVRRAIGYFEQTLAIHREIGDRRGEGDTLGNHGIARRQLGDARRAIGYYEKALVIARGVGDRMGEARGSFNMALLHHQQDDPARALGLAQDAARLFAEIGHTENARRADELAAELRRGTP